MVWNGANDPQEYGEVKASVEVHQRYACKKGYPGECWGNANDGTHEHIVYGQSGEYVVAWNTEGEIVRDDRPWQMTES